jgi:TolB-like protein
MPSDRPPLARFGAFEVDLRAGELRKQGRKLRLQEKPFQLLAALLEQPGEVVTRDELRLRLWPSDTFVDFDNGLNNAVAKLRSAVGDSAQSPKLIETLGRRGYRFIGALDMVGPASALPRASRLEQRVRSLAVLPLANLSSDPEQEYFSDGMTDSLIAQLSGIRALRVISRQSVMRYRKSEKSLPEIGRELNVDAVIEGTVLRTGNRVRITAQLVHAASDEHLWAEQYERELSDVLVLQSEIARAVAREVQITLTPQEASRLEQVRRLAPEAHDAYLRGRYLWNRRTEDGLHRSLDYYKQAIVIEPRFALAHAAIASSYGPLGYLGFLPPHAVTPMMKAAALRSLELDPELADGFTALGACAAFHEWCWVDAEKFFRQAIALNPSDSTAYLWYGAFLENMDRQPENLAARRRALELDPLNLPINANLGRALWYAGQHDEAVHQLRLTLDLEPTFVLARRYLGQIHLTGGQQRDGLAELENTARDGTLGHAYAVCGFEADARQIVSELEQASRERYVSQYEMALVYVGLGERDTALDCLERAFDTRAVGLVTMKIDTRLAPLQSDPRFRRLLTQMNL